MANRHTPGHISLAATHFNGLDARALNGSAPGVIIAAGGHVSLLTYRIDFGAFCPLGITVVYSLPFIRS
jgi:hypothetical protein